jgi:hypothetical protein
VGGAAVGLQVGREALLAMKLLAGRGRRDADDINRSSLPGMSVAGDAQCGPLVVSRLAGRASRFGRRGP